LLCAPALNGLPTLAQRVPLEPFAPTAEIATRKREQGHI
jgi:hypothetical protein